MDSFQTPLRQGEVGMTMADLMDISPPVVSRVDSKKTRLNDVMSENPASLQSVSGSPSLEDWSMLVADATLSACSSSSSVPGPDISAFGDSRMSAPKVFQDKGHVPHFLQMPSKSNRQGFKLLMRPRNASAPDALLLKSDSTFLPISPLETKTEAASSAEERHFEAGAVPPETREMSSCERGGRSSAVPPRLSLKRRSAATSNNRVSRCRIHRAPNEKIFLPHF